MDGVLTSIPDFGLGSRGRAIHSFVGEGIFTQDGSAWKRTRELLRRPFQRIEYQNLKGFCDFADQLVTTLKASNGAVDLQPLFLQFTLSTTTALIFGQPDGSLDKEPLDAFIENFDYAAKIGAFRIRLQDLYWLYTPFRYKRACDGVKRYADDLVRRTLQKDKVAEGETNDYAFIRDLHNNLQEPCLVRDQLLNILLAGRDSTACLLSWTFFLLARHPGVLRRTQIEIQSVLGTDGDLTRAHLQRMVYLKCVLNEVLRLYPSVPINVRIAKKTTWVPRGGGPDGQSPVLIRKGAGIGYAVYYMHRMKQLYGEDANDFRPDRWENGKLANIGWGYLPFSGGPRLCLGSKFYFRVLLLTA